LGFESAVDVRIERNRLVIAPERRPRQGWEEAFEAAGSSENDELLLDSAVGNDFDREGLVKRLGRLPAKTAEAASAVLVKMFSRL